jgi:hypothetical protein
MNREFRIALAAPEDVTDSGMDDIKIAFPFGFHSYIIGEQEAARRR